MLAPQVRFQPLGPFHADLKRRVARHFGTAPGATHASWGMRAKTAVLLTISIGLAQAGIGFSVMHDANHGGYSKSAKVNRMLGWLFCDLIGGSSSIWRHKHNVLHHTYTNVAGMDADLEAGPLLRFAPWQERRGFHRFQHLYVWLLYGVFPLRWFLFDDFQELASGKIGGARFPRPTGWALFFTLLGKAGFYAWAFVLPLLLHPGWHLVALWCLASFVVGNVMANVFQLAHCAGEAEFHAGADARVLETDWAVHQVNTTIDFARGNALLGWYLGGLNFQIEHHLFPRICHVHYRALSAIVEDTCKAHGLRYRVQPSFLSAARANLRWLRRMGSPQGAAA